MLVAVGVAVGVAVAVAVGAGVTVNHPPVLSSARLALMRPQP